MIFPAKRTAAVAGACRFAIDDETPLARAYLNRVAEPTSIPVWDWVRRVGPVAAAEAIRSGRLMPNHLVATEPEFRLRHGSHHL